MNQSVRLGAMQNTHFARARIDRIIGERFSSSFMNDSKWMKLIAALAGIGDMISSCKVKLVWDDSIRDLRIDSDIALGFDFYAHSMESMVSGHPKGFYDYKELEWIEFPDNGQNLEKIAQLISMVGQFELEKTTDGLRLYAYK